MPRAHLVQFDIAWEDPAENFRRVERLISRAPIDAGDLVVLPEMFDSGFSFETGRTADKEGRTLAFLVDLARDLGVYVQGARTVHECHCAKASNCAPIIGPDGAVLAEYRKIHPFTFGREGERFEGGRDVVLYEWARGRSGREVEWKASGGGARSGLRVCPAICYDLRFPELFRIGLQRGAEVFALGANWPDIRQHHWRALLMARAIENQAFVLGVNRVGRDPNLNYTGGSIALSPTGEVLGELGRDADVLSVEIDAGVLTEWREKFPAWRDAKLLAPPGGAPAQA